PSASTRDRLVFGLTSKGNRPRPAQVGRGRTRVGPRISCRIFRRKTRLQAGLNPVSPNEATMSDAQNAASPSESPMRLRDALRKARIEAADRTGVVVDLRDAEVARLEILNEALDPLFAQVPDTVDLFDRGISQGETP
ncbi:hypothetical protein KXV85_003719, partial [Aspergillus fumigatus]